ncbi:MAG: peptidoglycan DD-metalloendopeptidase family protein [Plectolyngbya sp. WJT66-NPBG17]|jgi:murein DD-endopeptidase MepM/ murein hydrolase activator NlpD|nr:peptidoglycan DD-metalloendopeptidase family protein [Plectolyngbya sp. WJT66-NPBG17]MBW4524691.1 peptidoglycan DD-metalloendopeptidase family protein [Phormidium tanganyikae FI6-MK23]
MKLNRIGQRIVQNLILFTMSFALLTTLGWQHSAIATQPAELITTDRFAQINVRTSPSTTAALTGFAYSGDRIQILDQTQSNDGYTWYEMQSNRSGIVGWVRGDLVRLLAAAPRPNLYNPSRIAAVQKNPTVPQSANCASVYPVPTPVINQGFGQVSDPFSVGHTQFHTGVDFDGRIGDPINSPVCGTVSYVGREQNQTSYEWGYGWHIKIRDQAGQIHLFAHISKAHVKVGQTVTPSQLIANMGNNGNSTGPHLHYEIRRGADDHQNAINPMLFLANAEQSPQTGAMPTESRSPLRF